MRMVILDYSRGVVVPVLAIQQERAEKPGRATGSKAMIYLNKRKSSVVGDLLLLDTLRITFVVVSSYKDNLYISYS